MYDRARMARESVPRWYRVIGWLVVVGVLGLAGRARAGGFGLVAAGDEAKQPVVETELGPWLTAAGKADVRIGTNALGGKQITQVVNCFILADQACATAAVASGALDGLLFVMVEVERDRAAAGDRIKITGWLYGAGGAPIAAQSLFCNDCRNDTLKPKLEELARLLFAAASSGAGRLSVSTRPAGATVLVDGEKIGVTPLTHGLREGPHTVTIELTGHETITRKVTIANDAESPLEADLVRIGGGGGGRGSRRPLAYGALAVGGAAILGGAAMIVLDPRCEVGSEAAACAPTEPTYTSTRLPGIVTAGAGVAVVGVGVYLLLRDGKRPRTAPVARVDAAGATFGVAGSF
jgi:hypothetical protein